MKFRSFVSTNRHLVIFMFGVVFFALSFTLISAQGGQRLREIEPNDTLTQAQTLPVPSVVDGDLDGSEEGQFELFGSATTADMYRFTISQPSTIVLNLVFGFELGFGPPGFLCGEEPFTCIDGNPDLFLLGFNPFRLIDFSAKGFINFGDTFFPGDPFSSESIPSPAPTLFGFSPEQPLRPGVYIIAISDQARAILSLLTNGSSVESLEPTVYRLQISAMGPTGQRKTAPAMDGRRGVFSTPNQGAGVTFGRVTASDLQAIQRAIGAPVNPRDVRQIRVARALRLQFDYYENTARAEAFSLLSQRGSQVSVLATATRVSNQYFKIEPMTVEAGTYFLVAQTGESAIYSLSVTDGVNPEPLLGAFRFPEISINQADQLSLTGVAPR